MNKNKNIFVKEVPSFDILYVCIGFSGFKMNSDKNFYLELFQELTKAGQRIFVISFSDPIEGKYYLDATTNSYPILHLKRPFHIKDPSRYWVSTENFLSYRHQHFAFMEHIERYLSLLYWNKIFKYIITRGKPKYIHYIDPFIGTRTFLGTKKIITQGKTDIIHPFIYRIYLNLLFKNADIGLFFNKAQLNYLPDRVTHKLKVVIQPWGVRNKEIYPQKENNTKFLYASEKILLLWSGYIQQVGYEDFLYAKQLAEKAVCLFDNIEFIFSFKPEINIDLPRNSERIKYLKSGSNFKETIESADIFFSPLKPRDTVIGPPLTWIEFISTKRPILTTNIKGLDSYFENASSILAFNNEEEFLMILKDISNKKIDLKIIGENAFKVFKNHFDLDLITERYLSIYKS